MKDGPCGPMHGIPIGLRDIVDSAGIETICPRDDGEKPCVIL